ncbi:PadR family transcriptional regulator [Brevibacterium sp. BRM-1]|uniref:PadR family transcriptional regulator n=1 Tax=Brevibacterium sp. BRM-1 TaxID=2999062 RepID=UPI003FA4421C
MFPDFNDDGADGFDGTDGIDSGDDRFHGRQGRPADHGPRTHGDERFDREDRRRGPGGRHGHGGPGGMGGPGFGGFGGGFDPNAMAAMFRRMTGMQGGRGRGRRMGRGDVRQAVLALLREEPMHGYQVIRELEERSGGAWKPSAGSVYPTLQMLADEGLIVADETGGKKVYSLTEEGRTEAEARSGEDAPWETAGGGRGFGGELPKASAKLAQAVAQVVRGGDQEQIKAATEIIDEARRRVYGMLAEE